MNDNQCTYAGNASIAPFVPGKPHICKRYGWWRVSPMKFGINERSRWAFAHTFAELMNRSERRVGNVARIPKA